MRLYRVAVLLLGCVLLQQFPTEAFTLYPFARSFTRSAPFSLRAKETAKEEYDELAPIDFRAFLTQRSIQSFMFLLAQTRDMYTIRWLDNFTQPVLPDVGSVELEFDDGTSVQVSPFSGESGSGGLFKEGSRLLQYHGLGAINKTLFPSWDSYFKVLLEQPAEVLEISSSNPGTPFQSFEIDIEPPRLCSRLLSVRSQIANEWVTDLNVLEKMGGQVFYSYWENVKNGKSQDEGFDREGMWFLDYIRSEENDFAPSPLRKGNFDLLKLLATEESVYRVLKNDIPLFADEEESNANSFVNREFLKSFYLERLDSHFRGYVAYGRADDFIEELMLVPPRMVTGGEDSEVTALVDPVRLAEIVMKEREYVAMDWKELASQAPNEHVEIQKLQLNKMMGL